MKAINDAGTSFLCVYTTGAASDAQNQSYGLANQDCMFWFLDKEDTAHKTKTDNQHSRRNIYRVVRLRTARDQEMIPWFKSRNKLFGWRE